MVLSVALVEGVVEGGGWWGGGMAYDTPSRLDIERFALFIRLTQILDRIKCKGDMYETRTLVVFVLCSGHVD